MRFRSGVRLFVVGIVAALVGVSILGSDARAADPIDVVAIAAAPSDDGYIIVESDGVVWAYGVLAHQGDLAGLQLAEPVVGGAVTPSGLGYWLVASDGGVFAFGDAGFFGSTGDIALNQPIVGMAAAPSGGGYWLVASDGGVFAFGDAGFFGSTGNLRLNRPVVGMAATPSGGGYWLVASDGGVFAFGDAGFFGSTGAIALDEPIISIHPTSSGSGYRMLAVDGGEFDFGDAGFIGSVAGRGVRFAAGAVGHRGDGHWLVTAGGQLQQSGLAPRLGAPVAGPPTAEVPPLDQTGLAWEAVGDFAEPIAIRTRPGDPTSVYVAERAGRIIGLDLVTGVRTTVLDMSSLTATNSERGLLGFDFSPDGSKAYLDHTNLAGSVELAEYDLSVTPPARRLLLTIPQPFANHNGGDVHVTADGLVWASSGDGGSGGDPANNAQNTANLLGTVYRIDPTPSAGAAYTVPADNPFLATPGFLPEIWSYGLRNPWRFSFDRATGDMWVADVGQSRREEINWEPAGAGGRNYGWKRFEGDVSFSNVSAPGAVDPLHVYSHADGCSVTGGVVSRGGLPELEGAYLFADFCRGTIWGLRQDGGVVSDVATLGITAPQAVAFGVDPNGEVLVAQLNGAVRRIVAG